jgi:hypothetical protein
MYETNEQFANRMNREIMMHDQQQIKRQKEEEQHAIEWKKQQAAWARTKEKERVEQEQKQKRLIAQYDIKHTKREQLIIEQKRTIDNLQKQIYDLQK